MVSIYKVCQNCGDKLSADSTWRRKFCSDLCRVQFHRKPKPKELYAEAATIIAKFKHTSKKDNIQAIDSLYALKVLIDDALADCGDRQMQERKALAEDMARKRNWGVQS
jgi:hypothetical protein